MEGQAKLIHFKYAISRPATLVFQQMLQKAEFNGVSSLTNEKFYFKPIYYYRNNTYEEYCNVSDLEEYPVEMIKYLTDNNFEKIKKGLDEALENATQLQQTLDRIDNGEETFNIDKIQQFFLEYKPYSIIIDDITGTTTICNVTSNIDKETKEQLIKYQKKLDAITTKLNLSLTRQIIQYMPEEYQEYAEVLTLEEIKGEKSISIEELKERKNGFFLHIGEVIPMKDIEKYTRKENINLPLRKKGQKEKRQFIGTRTYHGRLKSTNEPPVIIGNARLVYSIKDFLNLPSECILITPMIVREWEERLKEGDIQAIVTDEGNENSFLEEQKSTTVIGAEETTLYIKNDNFVKIEGETITKLTKIEAIKEYRKLLEHMQGQCTDELKSMMIQWKKLPEDEQIKKLREEIKKRYKNGEER